MIKPALQQNVSCIAMKADINNPECMVIYPEGC